MFVCSGAVCFEIGVGVFASVGRGISGSREHRVQRKTYDRIDLDADIKAVQLHLLKPNIYPPSDVRIVEIYEKEQILARHARMCVPSIVPC